MEMSTLRRTGSTPLPKTDVQIPSKRRALLCQQSSSQVRKKEKAPYHFLRYISPMMRTLFYFSASLSRRSLGVEKQSKHSHTKVHIEVYFSVRLKLTKGRKQRAKTLPSPELTLLCLGTKRSGKNS